MNYVKDLVDKNLILLLCPSSLIVYESLSAGIGSSVYNDQNYDTVYFNEEPAHDFAFMISFLRPTMEPKYQNGSASSIRETGFD